MTLLFFTFFFLVIFSLPGRSQTTLEADFKIYGQRTVGKNITFDATPTKGYSNPMYSWDFGDDKVGKGLKVVHKYSESGSYYVTLIVENADGGTDLETKRIYVSSESDPDLWIFDAMFAGFCLFYAFMLLIFVAIYVTNIVVLVVLYKKIKALSLEFGAEEEAKTYVTILLVIGIIGIVIMNFVIFTIIGQFIVFLLFKNMIDSKKQIKAICRRRGRGKGSPKRPGPPRKTGSRRR